MNRILSVVLAILCLFIAYQYTVQVSFINPYPEVCDLVAQKIFLDTKQIKKWKKVCHGRSRLVTPYSPKKLIIQDINNVLDLLHVSHLVVYDSSDVKDIWKGESLETGIESEFVDSELVIFKIHPRSPAELVGLKKGDIIKAINGEAPNPWEAQTISGKFLIERGKDRKVYTLKTAAVIRDEEIKFRKIDEDSGILEIPSFRAEFFSSKKIQDHSKNIQNLKNLIVDLRGNVGGNFVAGLRLLSLMNCSPQIIGSLIKTHSTNHSKVIMPNNLSDEKQIEIFEKYKEINLKTFAVSHCYHGKLSVLVDNKTASVAEMVAQALKEFNSAKVLGIPTRGQLLVGMWYPLESLGAGAKISIPEAFYLSHKNHRRIESEGVELDQVLYYDISELQVGRDSWVKNANY